MELCQIENCIIPAYSRGLCGYHYRQALAARTEIGPPRTRGTSEQLFWAKVDKRGTKECWEWTAARSAKGYGKAKFKHKWVSPHRFSYGLHNGPIPDGLEIDHLCRNKLCVNPAHLEAVTPKENMRRRKEATTHCKRGHEFTPENTRFHSKTGSKVCATCQRDYQREWMRRYRTRDK